MIFVIEGDRAVGKTTLIKNLAKVVKVWRFFDPSVPEPVCEKWERGDTPHEDMLRQVDEMGNDNKLHLVDRFHLTEFVLRTEEFLTADGLQIKDETRDAVHKLELEFKEVHLALREKHALILVLAAGSKRIEQRLRKRKDEKRRLVSVFTHYAFVAVASDLHIPLFRNDTLSEQLTTIIALLMVIHELKKESTK